MKAVRKGDVAIPSFDVDGGDTEMPYCCGIRVVGGFGERPLDRGEAAEALGTTLEDEDDYYDAKGNEREIYDARKGYYVPNPKYVKPPVKLDPDLDTTELTPARAKAFWQHFCEEHRVSQLMATLRTPQQDYAAWNLSKAGWKPVTTFGSRTTGSVLTVFSFTAEGYRYTNPQF